MDKQIVVYPYNGLIFSNKTEWAINSYKNTDEPQRHFSNWKKSDPKGYMLHDCIYVTLRKKHEIKRWNDDPSAKSYSFLNITE